MHVHLVEHIASGARFAGPQLLRQLAAYRDETAEAPVLDAAGVSVPVTIEVGEHIGNPADGARIRIGARDHRGRYPVFDGTLRIAAQTNLDSMLVLNGNYEVPFGHLGRLADRTVLRATAERSLARLVARMKAELSTAVLESVMGKVG